MTSGTLFLVSRDKPDVVITLSDDGSVAVLGRGTTSLIDSVANPSVSRKQAEVRLVAGPAVEITAFGRNPVCVIRRHSHTRKMLHQGGGSVRLYPGDQFFLLHSASLDEDDAGGKYLFLVSSGATGSLDDSSSRPGGAGATQESDTQKTVVYGSGNAGKPAPQSAEPSQMSHPPVVARPPAAPAAGGKRAAAERQSSGSDTAKRPRLDEAKPAGPWGRLKSLTDLAPSVDLVSLSLTVGRDRRASDLVIDSPMVSSRHFRVHRAGDDTFVTDLSTNGTHLDGKRLVRGAETLLTHGGELRIYGENMAPIPFIFTDASAEVPPEQRYIRRNLLGTGAFAAVHLVVDAFTGERFAMKEIDVKKMVNATEASLTAEATLMQQLDHPSIVKVVGLFRQPKTVNIVLELMSGGDLCDDVIENGAYPEPQAKDIARQLLSAVAYLHDRGIVHRDLKPENLLLKAKRGEPGPVVVKVTDFGISKIVKEGGRMETVCGTPQYLAPEVLRAQQGEKCLYDKSVDIFAAGGLLYVCLSGFPPFSGETPATLLKEVTSPLRWHGPAWGKISNECKDLISRMLDPNPNTRIKMPEILAHPWLR
jgi:tRNA A-37 threonylcarbamoyl transferase component Bud32/pSer/pThr/pTyr-binding forkhead associated (FHA) protein